MRSWILKKKRDVFLFYPNPTTTHHITPSQPHYSTLSELIIHHIEGAMIARTTNRLMSTISKSIKLYPEVSEALSNNRPLVAFESTILTHGLPYPDNLNLSKSLTQICEENGVVGATIAIHEGKIKVGLSPEEIDDICSSSTPNNPKPSPIKGTTRQLGYLLHQTKQMDNLWGGTTVASTSYIASKIGIKVFVTGGAGGVHRRLSPSDPLDVSADLVQLANNPNPLVTVSSGVKSILDVPNTLETLETLGVTVGAYKSEYFPMFYSDFDESIKSPIVFGSPEEVAQTLLMNASIDYGGVLCAVPKPELLDKIEAGMTPRQLIENSPADKTLPIIAEALKAAKEQNIIGKDVTPFVLEKVKVLTGGETVAVNVGLVQNNLRVGIEIAKALHSGHDSDHKDDLAAKLASDIIVMGGAVIDSVSNAQSATSSILPNTSSIGTTRETHGGVGRNISEAIGKVLRSSKRKIAFHTVLGGDQTSENINAAITENLKEAGVEQVVANVLCGARTARYTAILQNSDLAYAVADMELFSKDANWRLPTDPELERARALVVDCNLPPTTLSAAINRFRQTEGGKNDKKVVVVDPTSVEKAGE